MLEYAHLHGDPAALLTEVNAALKPLLSSGQYATMFYCVVDGGRDELIWAAGGWPQPLLMSDGILAIDSKGIPLGVAATTIYENRRIAFPPGSELLVYSDAVSERDDGADGQVGLDGVLALAESARRLETGNLHSLLDSFFALPGRGPEDDLTLLWLRRLPAGAAIPGIVCGAASEAEVRRGLRLPNRGFCEGPGGFANPRCLEALVSGGFALSLSTASTYRLDVANMVGEAVSSRLLPPGRVASEVFLVVAEAVANAVIHGNLGIQSDLRGTREGLAAFSALMATRLAEPERAARRVEICAFQADGGLTLTVSDQGEGFDLDAQLRRPIETAARNGRGLALIRKVAGAVGGEDGGRTLVMRL